MDRADFSGTVLVVDDSERNIEVVGTTLAAMGLEVIPATSGEQALARIQARVPDLVLLDILMPGMDGFEVCHKLKSEPDTMGIPIIFLSAADEKEMIVRALEAGGVDYVTKPFSRVELQARVKTHLELKRARDELHHIVEQREELMGILAHDLKNPLFSLQLSSQVLNRMVGELPEAVGEIADTIKYDTDRAFSFIDEFLAKAAADRTDIPVKLVEVDLADCIDSTVINHAERARRKNISLNWQNPHANVSVSTDPFALGSALSNLISNALKFSARGSSVWVTLDPEVPAIRIRDEGPGFTDEDKARLFERFVRLSAQPTGGETSTGLGLSIAKKLVEAVGGTLTCESEVGKGAEFEIALSG